LRDLSGPVKCSVEPKEIEHRKSKIENTEIERPEKTFIGAVWRRLVPFGAGAMNLE
jgi:hypothetical protein